MADRYIPALGHAWLTGAFFFIQLLDGFTTTAANVAGEIPAMLRAAGLTGVREAERLRTLFGTLSLYRGERSQ